MVVISWDEDDHFEFEYEFELVVIHDKEDEYSHEANWGKVLLAGYAGYELCCAVVLCKCIKWQSGDISVYTDELSGQILSLKLT